MGDGEWVPLEVQHGEAQRIEAQRQQLGAQRGWKAGWLKVVVLTWKSITD